MVDETWDVPDDHFTDNVLNNSLRLRQGLTEDERFYVRCRGNWTPDLSDSAFNVPSGDHGFHGWNPKCVSSIYYINWKIEQIARKREECQYPDFEAAQKKKTSSVLRREKGEERRKAGIKEKYGATKCYREKKPSLWWRS